MLPLASGSGRFYGAVQVPGLTLGTFGGRVDLEQGGRFTFSTDVETIGNVAGLELSGRGEVREGGVDLSAGGQLRIFGIPSLRLSAAGSVESTGEYSFAGSASGYVPPLTYAFGSFRASSAEGFSGEAHVFGLTVVPAPADVQDLSPIPDVARESLGLPDDPSLSTLPAIGYSYFGYSQGRGRWFSIGVVPFEGSVGAGASLSVPFEIPVPR